jgi:hypothetical protein
MAESVVTEPDEVDGHPRSWSLSSVAASLVSDSQLTEHELYVAALENQDTPATGSPLESDAWDTYDFSIDAFLADWDAEEEYFDAENYSVARYENTTGTSMIVPEPRFTARTAQELAHASDWVDENTSDDEMEEEAWDITLVSEYSDEIFDYLRKVEVIFPSQHRSLDKN